MTCSNNHCGRADLGELFLRSQDPWSNVETPASTIQVLLYFFMATLEVLYLFLATMEVLYLFLAKHFLNDGAHQLPSTRNRRKSRICVATFIIVYLGHGAIY